MESGEDRARLCNSPMPQVPGKAHLMVWSRTWTVTKGERLMRRTLTVGVILLTIALLTFATALVQTSTIPRSAQAADITPTVFLYFPMVSRYPTPTPIPRARVYVDNNTGGRLCFKIKKTGIGERCFSSGRHYYGSFPVGTYTWHASARCGSASDTKYYGEGTWVQAFECRAAAFEDQHVPVLRHSLR